jgi:hypothetical protein
MELGDKRLIVQRVHSGSAKAAMDAGLRPSAAVMTVLATKDTVQEESTVVQLMNMVEPEELEADDDYEGSTLSNKTLYRCLHIYIVFVTNLNGKLNGW